MHVQRMLKMSRIYTLTEIINNILVKKQGKLGTLFTTVTYNRLLVTVYDHGLTT